jgi:hypothetical protein
MAREQIGHKHPEGSVAPGLGVEVTASGGTARTLLIKDGNSLNLLDSADGVAYVLPVITAATIGMAFHFYASVSVTSSDVYSVTTGVSTQKMGGAVDMGIAATDTNEMQVATSASHLTITMNGSTTGGLEGTYFSLYAISATLWICTGLVVGSGSLSTPFA